MAQAVTKILRHGKKAVDHTEGFLPMEYDNIEHLHKELVDVFVAARLCDAVGATNFVGLDEQAMAARKIQRLQTYIHTFNVQEVLKND